MILGIDPGFTGAFCAVKANGNIYMYDTPLLAPEILTSRDKFRSIDAKAITLWLKPKASEIQLVVLEKVGAAPGQGVSSMFRFGEGYGLIQGVLAGLGIERLLKTPPAVWKTKMGLSYDKSKSLKLAATLAPNYKHLFTRAKDDGRAEALLLAMFGARSLGWDFKTLGETIIDDIL